MWLLDVNFLFNLGHKIKYEAIHSAIFLTCYVPIKQMFKSVFEMLEKKEAHSAYTNGTPDCYCMWLCNQNLTT